METNSKITLRENDFVVLTDGRVGYICGTSIFFEGRNFISLYCYEGRYCTWFSNSDIEQIYRGSNLKINKVVMDDEILHKERALKFKAGIMDEFKIYDSGKRPTEAKEIEKLKSIIKIKNDMIELQNLIISGMEKEARKHNIVL